MPTEQQDFATTEQTEIVYGKNPVVELLKSTHTVDTVYVSQAMQKNEQAYYASLAKQKGAVLKTIHPVKLEKLCGSARHQGIAALQAQVAYCSLEDILAVARGRGEPPFVVLLDGIEDPHNLGAIIRTAECAGAHGVVFPKRGGSGVNGTVNRAAAGAVSHIALARVPNLADAVRKLKDAGVFCFCADMDGEYCANTNLTGPLAVVVGSEGDGVSRLVKQLCDGSVSLPIRGKISSLNASVAAGAVIYEAVRQRINSKR